MVEGAIDLTYENSFVSIQFKRTYSLTFRTTPDCRPIIFSSRSHQRRALTSSIDQIITAFLSAEPIQRQGAHSHTFVPLSPYDIHPVDSAARSRAVPKLIVHFLLSISNYLDLITTPSWSAQPHCRCCSSTPARSTRAASLSRSRRRETQLSFLKRHFTPTLA
jgi:hypothetical protein